MQPRRPWRQLAVGIARSLRIRPRRGASKPRRFPELLSRAPARHPRKDPRPEIREELRQRARRASLGSREMWRGYARTFPAQKCELREWRYALRVAQIAMRRPRKLAAYLTRIGRQCGINRTHAPNGPKLEWLQARAATILLTPTKSQTEEPGDQSRAEGLRGWRSPSCKSYNRGNSSRKAARQSQRSSASRECQSRLDILQERKLACGPSRSTGSPASGRAARSASPFRAGSGQSPATSTAGCGP